jgi:hypothetical protein
LQIGCRLAPVPFEVKRFGSQLRVDIDLPVDDWERLLDLVNAELEGGGIRSVVLPTLDDARPADRAILWAMEEMLKTAGIEIQRPPESEAGP